MKATGEVMAIGPNMEMALMKAIRSLEENIDSLSSGSTLCMVIQIYKKIICTFYFGELK